MPTVVPVKSIRPIERMEFSFGLTLRGVSLCGWIGVELSCDSGQHRRYRESDRGAFTMPSISNNLPASGWSFESKE